MDKQSASKNSAKLIEAKQEELTKQIFPWLKEQGLALVAEQVRLTIKINKRADTFELTDKDWKIILGEEWNWTSEEVKILKKIKKASNNWTLLRERNEKDSRIDNYKFQMRMRVNFSRSRQPYFLSARDEWAEDNSGVRKLWGQIGKRLTPKERRRG